jgi:hypothetical protein
MLMAKTNTFVVMLQITTDDPRLSETRLIEALHSGKAEGFAAARTAVMQRLPEDVTRLIAVMPVEQARLLMMLHESVGSDIAGYLRKAGFEVEDPEFRRPPPDYIPPGGR